MKHPIAASLDEIDLQWARAVLARSGDLVVQERIHQFTIDDADHLEKQL